MSEELFRAIQRGDQTAFKHFYEEYYRWIYRFIVRIIKDEMEAEDIAVSCFIKIWKSLAKVKNPGHQKSLLLAIARNLCIDHLRRLKKKGKQVETDAMLEKIEDPSYLEGVQVESDLLMKVFHYMDQLGDTRKAVLRLHYLVGLDYAEIAEQMGMKEKNVRLLGYRGIVFLRSKMLQPALLPLLLILYFLLHDDNHPVAPFLDGSKIFLTGDDIRTDVFS